MLLLEIALAIAVWRRGWGAWALVPIACTVLIGFITGMMLKSLEIDTSQVLSYFMCFSLLDLAVLGIMYSRPPASTKPQL